MFVDIVVSREEQNKSMNGWYWNRDVQRVLLSSMGAWDREIFDTINKYKRLVRPFRIYPDQKTRLMQENNDLYSIVRDIEEKFPGIEWGVKKLSESRNLREVFGNTLSAFVAINDVNGKRPYESIPITDLRGGVTLANHYIDSEDPPLEIHHSLVGKPLEKDNTLLPSRVLFALDIEMVTPERRRMETYNYLFDGLDTAKQIIEDMLFQYGISHSCIITGKGFHFISQVLADSSFMNQLARNVNIEPTIRKRIESNKFLDHFGFRVPMSVEVAFRNMTRLQQYFLNKAIRKIRKNVDLPVEISDRQEISLSLDNTNSLRTAQDANIRSPASVYNKFYNDGGRIIAPLTKDHNGIEWIRLDTGTKIRSHLDKMMEQFRFQVGYIPEGSEGLERLFNEYLESRLCWDLHRCMDSKEYDDFSAYRRHNYAYLRPITGNVWDFAAPRGFSPKNLLNPNVLNNFIYALSEKSWHPKDIAGLICAIYTDERFDFRGFFDRFDASRHANGWVEAILGQSYEEN